MPLYADMAESFLDSNKDEIDKMEPEAKKQFIDSVLSDFSQMPELNIQDAPVPPGLEKQSIEAETAYARELDQWNRNTQGMPEDYRQQIMPKEWSGLKETRRNIELQRMGVDTTRPLPAGSKEIGFGVDPVESVKGALTEYFGKEVPVFKSKEDIIYIDPFEKRPIKVNPGISAKIGESIPVATEIAGSLLTKRVGSPAAVVAKESALSGAGASVGKLAQLEIGKLIGAHGLTQPEILQESGVYGAQAAAVSMFVGNAIAGLTGFNNIIKGRIFNKQDAIDVGVPAQHAEEVVDEVNKFIQSQGGKAEFKPTLGQKTDDITTQAAEQEVRRKVEYAKDFANRDAQNAVAEKEALDLLTRPELKPYATSTVGDVAEQKVYAQVKEAELPVIKTRNELAEELSKIGGIKKEAVGKDALNIIESKKAIAKLEEDNAWGLVRKSGGYDESKKLYNIEIPKDEFTISLDAILKRQAKTGRTSIGSSSVSGIFNDIKKGKSPDLADYNREISRLKTKLRGINNNPSATDMDAKDLGDVIKAMEADRKLALYKAGKGDLMDKIEAAEKVTANYHATYERSVIGDLTALNKNGIPNIKTKDFVDNMLSRDVSEVQNFKNIIGDNPELINQWKLGIGDAYKRVAYPDGKFSRRASNEFIDRNKDNLLEFYSEKEIKSFKNTGELYKKAEKQAKDFEIFKKRAQEKYGAGVLSRIDPENMVKFVTGNSGSWITAADKGVQNSINKIKFVKNMTNEYPGAWQSFKNDFSLSLKNDLVDAKTGRINETKIANWVNDSGKSKIIKEVMGEEYYKNLSTIHGMVKILNKPMTTLAKSEASRGIIQAVRAGIAPPLTSRGRAFTALLLFNNSKGHKATAEALLDNRKLKEVAALAEHDVITRRIAEKAVSLGFGIPDEE